MKRHPNQLSSSSAAAASPAAARNPAGLFSRRCKGGGSGGEGGGEGRACELYEGMSAFSIPQRDAAEAVGARRLGAQRVARLREVAAEGAEDALRSRVVTPLEKLGSNVPKEGLAVLQAPPAPAFGVIGGVSCGGRRWRSGLEGGEEGLTREDAEKAAEKARGVGGESLEESGCARGDRRKRRIGRGKRGGSESQVDDSQQRHR